MKIFGNFCQNLERYWSTNTLSGSPLTESKNIHRQLRQNLSIFGALRSTKEICQTNRPTTHQSPKDF